MNQGKLKVVKQEMSRVNINILGITELNMLIMTKCGTLEKGSKPLQYSCLENSMKSMKMQKDRTLKDELPRSVGA